MFARKKTQKNDYIQDGCVAAEARLWESRRPTYLRFLRIIYMKPLTKVKAKATQARMKE